jgi:bifunctional enzyme CysN/CysC
MAGDAAFRRYAEDQHSKDLLRLITCGSVDDGKSTLIGRLLLDTGSVPEDLVRAAQRDSERWGTNGDQLDVALLVDGLQSEREQGITIDVAHRYFDTARRKFILADTPGHEQYTRNMATAASTATAAVLLLDASRGLQPQTLRHACIARLMGVRQFVVAVNKMDLAGHDPAAFERIVAATRAALARLPAHQAHFVPVAARSGDNVVRRSAAMPWYGGPTLLELLEALDASEPEAPELRLPVQYVARPHEHFRGYAGTITGGRLQVGDDVVALPSGVRSRVLSIGTAQGGREQAGAGEAVMVTLADAVDIGRGQVLAHLAAPPSVGTRFEAEVVWMAAQPLVAGGSLEFKFAHRYVAGSAARVVHRVDVTDLGIHPAATLGLNDVGRCEFVLAEAVAFDSYDEHRTTGSFVVIDRVTRQTLGAGMVRSASHGRLVAAPGQVSRAQRAAQKHQRPAVVWLNGLSGSGKSTIAVALDRALFERGHHAYLLDGDGLRQGLNRDLGFSPAERRENLRRAAELARVLADAGLVVIAAFISPLQADRDQVRAIVGADLVEVHVDAPLAECERRDPKGHYRRARAGALRDFTGVDAPYEPPQSPDLRLDTVGLDVPAAVERLLRHLESGGYLASAG